MTVTLKTTHTTEAIGRLITQFKGSSRLHALIKSYVDQIQELEIAAYTLLTDRAIDTAEGAQLDGIGEIVGLRRGGLTDDEYRVRLAVQIRLNLSSGTIEDIAYVGNLITGDIVEINEYFPATILVVIYSLTADPALVQRIINEARAAGVQTQIVYSLYPAAETFATSSIPGTVEIDANAGFSDTTQTTGGRFAGLLEA